MVAMALAMVFAAGLIYAAISDLLTMTIPNKVSIALAAIFPLAALAAGLPWQEFFMHLGAGAIILAAGIALFAAGVFGGGDAKLLAVSALWVGFDQLLPLISYVAILGGCLAAIVITFRQCPEWVTGGAEWSQRLYSKQSGVPYGVAISAAGLIVFAKTNFFALMMA